MSTSFWFRIVLAVVSCTSFALAGDVRIVDAIGTPPFADIQSAVNAAPNGSVLLIAGGNYAPFSIAGKDLYLVAVPGETVMIQGTIDISNLAAQSVVLAGISAQAVNGAPGLRLSNNVGQVRAQGCSFTGGRWLGPSAAGAGASITGTDVAFTNCTLRGGYGELIYDSDGAIGGAGISAQSSRVALYTCQALGGQGGYADGGDGGNGGAGFDGSAFYLFASSSSFIGGRGGDSYDFWGTGTHAGNGGTGLAASAVTQVDLLSNSYTGGQPGQEMHFGGFGVAGAPYSVPGNTNFHSGAARTFSAPAVVSDQTNLFITINGQPGDQVYILRSSGQGFVPAPEAHGAWLVSTPLFARAQPIAVLPISGALQIPLPDVQFPLSAQRFAYQGLLVSSSGQAYLGSPFQLALLNRAAPPDCDGNGVQDYVDLISGAADCNDDLELDACQIASGSLPDCNANQIPDGCDIASGTGHDFNQNGVLDECEPAGSTWYVDASAVPGGNGSAAAPFQTIGEGLGASVSGHTVVVADGIYTGAGNRELDFGGRNVIVRSANGPTACTIDCELAGRAFKIHSGETPAARVQGFTIIRGVALPNFSGGGGILVDSASPTIVECVIRNCSAESGFGGGLFAANSRSLVEHCTFIRNVAASSNAGGGGVAIHNGLEASRVRLSKCHIEGNWAMNGGGILLAQPFDNPPAVVSHCTIVGNTSWIYGGGLYTDQANPTWQLVIDNCLIAGNTGGIGGGLAGRGSITVSCTTIVGNRATAVGGGVCAAQTGRFTLVDSILWGNTAQQGAQAALRDNLSSLTVSWCDLEGGPAAVLVPANTTLTWGAGNLALDPQLVDPDGPDGNPLTLGDNDYRLSLQSPCIDAGDNAGVAADWFDLDGNGNTLEPVPFDFDFLPRFVDVPAIPDTGSGAPPLVDLGTYEHP